VVGESMQKITLSNELSGKKSGKKKLRKKRKSDRSFIGEDSAIALPLLGPKLMVDGWSTSASANDIVRL